MSKLDNGSGNVRLERQVRHGKARIIERTGPDGQKTFVIQQRHFLFRWWWVDAWVNALEGASCNDSFPTMEEAMRNMCYFDGTPVRERVVHIA